jgi:hypothetical protein
MKRKRKKLTRIEALGIAFGRGYTDLKKLTRKAEHIYKRAGGKPQPTIMRNTANVVVEVLENFGFGKAVTRLKLSKPKAGRNEVSNRTPGTKSLPQ